MGNIQIEMLVEGDPPPPGETLKTLVMCGLVLLVATGNCWISYKNGCAGPFVLHLLLLLNRWLIEEI